MDRIDGYSKEGLQSLMYSTIMYVYTLYALDV